VKPIRWSREKNRQLQAERGVRFEMVLALIRRGDVLDIIEHPNQERYPNQRQFIVAMNEYVYLVSFVENDAEIFLKTIIPSRKLKKRYLGE